MWALANGGTLTEAYYRHPVMLSEVDRLSRTDRFGAAVAFSSSMAPYLMRTRVRRRVMDFCDCDSQKWLAYAEGGGFPARVAYKMEGKRLARRERAWASVFDATILITSAEAKSLRPYVARGRLHVVGNGVSLPLLPEAAPVHPPTVGFVGVMDYQPNVDAVCRFVDRCWMEIREAIPGARFLIVGRSPVAAVRRLARLPGVEVTGGVPDVRVVLERMDVSVAPMRIAQGLQNKVLEAMASAKPVVMSCRAEEGLGGEHGRDYIVSKSDEAFIRDVRHLLRDASERRRIGEAARQYVATHHRWGDMLSRFELIVTGQVQRSSPVADVASLRVPPRPVFETLS